MEAKKIAENMAAEAAASPADGCWWCAFGAWPKSVRCTDMCTNKKPRNPDWDYVTNASMRRME